MKKTIYILLLIAFSTISLKAQTYSYEVKMDNFEQVSETEFQWDIFLRKGVGSDDWALYTMQMRWQYDVALYNGGSFETDSLTIISDSSELIVKNGWFNDSHFTKVNPGGTGDLIQWATVDAPTPGDPVNVFDDYSWKRVARFSAKLLKNGNLHNFADIDPEFAISVAGQSNLIVMRCDYTGSNPNAKMSGIYNYEIDPTTRVVIPGLGVKVNDRQLAGYWFSGDGLWNENARWNNITTENANTLPGANSNAIIYGNCIIPDNLDISLLPNVSGNGGELTILNGEPSLYSLELLPNGTNVSVTLYGAAPGYPQLTNPSQLQAGTEVNMSTSGGFGAGTFINWTDQYNTVLSTDVNFGPYYMPAEDMIITANWTSGSKGTESVKGSKANLYASLTIAPGGRLTVFTLYNDNINGSEALVVQADEDPATPDGSLITDNAGVPGIDERYIVEDSWHYVSSSISNGVSGIFLDIWLKEFDEADSVWTYIIPVNEPLTPLKGYACWSYNTGNTPPGIGSTKVFFDGNLNAGQYSITVTNHAGAGATHNSKGFNFVGNPFPSAVDWDAAGWTKTNIDNTIYIFNPTNGQYGTYTGSGSGTNGVTNIIPHGQGFFVHVPTTYATGTLGVNNSARVHNDKPLFKGSGSKDDIVYPYLKLKSTSDINEYSDEAVIRFLDDATADFDSQYDAFKLQGVDEAPQMSTVSEGIEFAINSLPLSDEDVTIPVKFDVGIDGIYTIEAAETANLEDMYIYLKDLQEDVIINLNEQQNYSFFSTVDDDPARFEILFKSSPLGIGSYDITGNIRIYSDRNVVYLVSNDDLSGILKIYDMSGKTVYSDDLMGLSAYEVKLNVEKGFYIVKLFTDDKILSEKVVIFN